MDKMMRIENERKKLPVKKRRLFSTYKLRFIGRGLSIDEAIVAAGDKLGIKSSDMDGVNNEVSKLEGVDDEALELLKIESQLKKASEEAATRQVKATEELIDTVPYPVDVLSTDGGNKCEDRQQSKCYEESRTSSLKVKRSYSVLEVVELVACSIIFVVLTSAMIYFSAKSGDYSKEAWFFAATMESLGSIFLVYKTLNSFNKFVLRAVGLCCLIAGFKTMQLGILRDISGSESVHRASQEEKESLQTLINLKTQEISNFQKSLDKLSHIKNRDKFQSKIVQATEGLKALLSRQQSLNASLTRQDNNQVLSSKEVVSVIQRVLLILCNIIVGHGSANALSRLTARARAGPGLSSSRSAIDLSRARG